MKNAEIAALFSEIADFLEIKGENPFRVRAYRRAAQTMEGLAEDVAAVADRRGLLEISGIGKDLAGKIQEFLQSGAVEYLEGLRREIPAGVVELMRIHGVGPKTAKLLYEQVGVDSVEKLEELAKEHKLAGVPGIQAKTEENILKGIAVWRGGRERTPLGAALSLAETILETLRDLEEVDQISTAGSLRRMKETVKDIDILVTSKTPARIMEVFVGLPNVAEVLAHGETKSSLRLREGIQVDLRVVEPDCFGAALQYFTGSKQHNIRVRELAQRRELKVSEYGVFDGRSGKRVAGATEEDVYRAVGLPFIPPELREDVGEIEAALADRLPTLVALADIRGDLQLHTTWSDGAHSLADLAAGVQAKGYQYMAVTDHSKSVTVAKGMDEARVVQMIAEVRSLNRRLKSFRVLAGCEVDILADGSLDFPDEILAQLDLVQVSVHSRFKMSMEEMTARIVRAVRHSLVHILGHPTGRLIGERAAYEVDMEAVLQAAKVAGIAVEITASPSRLDLNDLHARRAKELGIPITISTDAHAMPQLDFMRYGVAVARRAWLTPGDVLNTLPDRDLVSWLGQRRRPV
ncbi:MAG: DNA polymerase/3'-5' exonuclease PolX [candidate division NC10 bacterium]|nr:DNA polymerase/3'-5' exonuclease PolX [candidate division NC10 bacterium]